jgi:hypothetical protein
MARTDYMRAIDQKPAIGTAVQFNVEGFSGGTGGTNADTVDGFHASATPKASTLLALNSSAQFPNSVIAWSNVDHGALGGLSDDDHTQYLNATRHDTTGRHSIGTVVPVATPSITLGTSASPGSANSVIRSDATIAAFDTGNPSTIAPDSTASPGTVNYAARRDHVHAITCAAPNTNLSSSSTNAEGNANYFARSDHTHAITCYNNGDAYKGHILKTDTAGYLKVTTLETANKVTTPLIDSTSGASIAIRPAEHILFYPYGTTQKPIKITGATGAAIQSDNFTSQTTGWRITYIGEADFRYLYTDELHAKAFIADLEQALAGGQIISKSVAVLAADFDLPSAGNSADFWVEDLPGAPNMRVFQPGDWVRFRKFSRSEGSLAIADAWGTVSNYVDGSGENEGKQKWTFTRSSTVPGSASGTVPARSLVLDYGVSGNGYYEVNAIDGLWGQNSPYAQTVVWNSDPTNRTVTTRLGNLRGIFSVDNEHGLYAGNGTATTSKYLRLSNSAAELHNLPLYIYDSTTLAIKVEPSGPYLSVGNPAPSSYLGGNGIWFGKDGSSYKAFCGTVSGGDIVSGWKWDGATLTVKGQIYVTGGDAAKTDLSNVAANTVVDKVNAGSTLIQPGRVAISGSTTLEHWRHPSDTTLIDGGKIYAGSITANKITVTNFNMVDNWSFEYGSAGWTLNAGATIYSGGGHTGDKRLAGDGGRNSGYVYASQTIEIQAGAVYYAEIWCYVSSNQRPTGMTISWRDKNFQHISYTDCYGLTGTVWTRWQTLAVAPSNAAYAVLWLCQWGDPASYPGAAPRWDDVVFRAASGMNLLVGNPGGARVEINNNGIEGYDSSGTKQFYIRTSDGRAAFGPSGKASILDSNGLAIYGNETNYQDWVSIRWLTSPPSGNRVAHISAGLWSTSNSPQLEIVSNPGYTYAYSAASLTAYAQASDRFATVAVNGYNTAVTATSYLSYGHYYATHQLWLDSDGDSVWTLYAGTAYISGKLGIKTFPPMRILM